MVEITCVEGAETLRAFRRASALPESVNCEAYQAVEKGKRLCYCLYRLEGDRLDILAVGGEDYDAPLCDGLLRTVFYAGLRRGAATAHLEAEPAAGYRRLLAEAGYPYKTDNDIDNFLTNQQNCSGKA